MEIKFEVKNEDPLNVLASTKSIVEDLHFLSIDGTRLDVIAWAADRRIREGLAGAEESFGITGNYEQDVQLVFLLDTVNFCFWPERGKPKWRVAWPENEIAHGGWYSLVKCFRRAAERGPWIFDADVLERLDIDNVKRLFEGLGKTEIPLLAERISNLREAGAVLNEKFDGEFINLLDAAGYDAVKTARLVCENFPSFRDKTELCGKEIFFLKRAQILSQDISYIPCGADKFIQNLDLLTAFADYRLPQMLRHYGAIAYSRELAEKIDRREILPAGCREEIEIRAATIWCVELMRQKLKCRTAAEIDNAVWLMSQHQTGMKPHHRTRTIFY